MERELERHLYHLQAELCHAMADPTRLELLDELRDGPRSVKELTEATGQRQATISQHLAVMRQRGIVRAERRGTQIHYSVADPRMLEACHITRAVLLQQLATQGDPAAQLTPEPRS